MLNNNNITTIESLGEFRFIDRITQHFKLKNSSTKKGIGDDAAVLDFGSKKTLVSTELFTEGIHFNLMYFPLKHLGYKTVVSGISDIYAMNATPKQITISLAISNKFSVESIEELYSGIQLACEKYHVDLVGGDTTASLTGLSIGITVIGEADDKDIIYRKGASPNDLLCITGDLGGAYMGLQLLERENEVFKVNNNMQPQLTGYDYILERQLKPEARADMLEHFRTIDIHPTSMIDVSDGLSSEIMHLCNSSKLGCRLYEEKIPMDNQTKQMAQELNINPLVAVLNGGEDYELLFTIPLEAHGKIKNDPNITIIGNMTKKEEDIHLITTGGSKVKLIAQGWKEE